MRVLELFAGIGGFAAAFPNVEIVSAVDIDQSAQEVYSANFKHTYSVKEISSLSVDWFASHRADLWWMSPPCTPYTQRGARRDLNDRRSDALRSLIDAVVTLRPNLICIENVVGFESSQAFYQLHDRWTRVGYQIQTRTFCPSTIGWPNRRPRVYLIATLEKLPEWNSPKPPQSNLSRIIESSITPESHPTLWLDANTIDRYLDAMDRVSAHNDSAITASFGASYGRTIVRSGSYLKTEWGYRRFSPREVARLLGFADEFRLLDKISNQKLWHMLGNSLSLPAVRHVLGGLVDKDAFLAP